MRSNETEEESALKGSSKKCVCAQNCLERYSEYCSLHADAVFLFTYHVRKIRLNNVSFYIQRRFSSELMRLLMARRGNRWGCRSVPSKNRNQQIFVLPLYILG